MRKLTDKQQAFVDEYCSNGYNGVQAAKSAGYKGSYSTLNNMARDNLQKPAIKVAKDEYIKDRQEKCAFNREQSELELIHAQERAIEKGDIAAEISAIREKNTIFALRSETILHDQLPEQRAFTLEEQADLKAAGELLLQRKAGRERAKLRLSLATGEAKAG